LEKTGGIVSYLWALACFKVNATSFSVSAMFELKFDNTLKMPDTLNVSVQRCGSVYGFVGQLCRRHDELACDGFGDTGGWG
jgi:hypothetical protein